MDVEVTFWLGIKIRSNQCSNSLGQTAADVLARAEVQARVMVGVELAGVG